jgi:class 3 adenylate cyclase/tetratricopeptide (TPR) repeat protein
MKSGHRKVRGLAGDAPASLPSSYYRRRLMAVMFTDITGFSARMGEDEERTMRMVQQHRKIVRGCIERYEGTEHETIGDAFVVLFESASNAVRCACAIHQALAESNATKPRPEQVWIRAGIHLGDVMFSADEEIYGDCVNVAARVQPTADPGTTNVTAAVETQCRGKLDVAFRSLGVRPLKHIKEPPELFQVVPGVGLAAAAPAPARGSAAGRARARWLGLAAFGVAAALAAVAVLIARGPSGREGAGPAAADGALRTAAASDAGAAPPAADAGGEPPDAAGPPGDARPPTDPDRTVPVFSDDPAAQKRLRTAYESYLTGHLGTAESEFRAGLAADDRSPLAHFMLSDILLQTGREDAASAETQTFVTQVQAALARTPEGELPPEHRLLALIMSIVSGARTPEQADQGFGELAELYPNLSIVYVVWGTVLTAMGRCDLAEQAFARSIERDTSAVMAFVGQARCALMAERHDRVREVLEQAMRWHPDSPYLLELLGETYFVLQRPDEAFAHVRRAVQLDAGLWGGKLFLLFAYELTDRPDDVATLLAELTGEGAPPWVRLKAVVDHATTLAHRGRFAEALELAQAGRLRALEAGEHITAWRLAAGAMTWNILAHRWDEATALLDELRTQVTDLAFPGYAKNYRLADLKVFEGLLAVERGEAAQARAVLDKLEELKDEVFPYLPKSAVVRPLKWRVLALEGRLDEALALLGGNGSPVSGLEACTLRRDEARVLLLAERPDEAAAKLDQLLERAFVCTTLFQQGYAVAEALVWRARIALDAGDAAAARPYLDRFRAHWPRPDAALGPAAEARRLASRAARVP